MHTHTHIASNIVRGHTFHHRLVNPMTSGEWKRGCTSRLKVLAEYIPTAALSFEDFPTPLSHVLWRFDHQLGSFDHHLRHWATNGQVKVFAEYIPSVTLSVEDFLTPIPHFWWECIPGAFGNE